MTDLTEEMKKGKLPEGWYYVIKTGDVEMLEYCCNCFLAGDVPLIDNEVTEVLAPVPTFEEWEQLQNWAEFTDDYHALREAKEIAEYENAELLEKVKQLKELLKEIRQQITEQVFGSPKLQLFEGTFDNKLLAKIDEVLK